MFISNIHQCMPVMHSQRTEKCRLSVRQQNLTENWTINVKDSRVATLCEQQPRKVFAAHGRSASVSIMSSNELSCYCHYAEAHYRMVTW
jgi:hypothetical protein